MKIKFLTVNIWQGGILFEKMRTFIQQEDPDILCLQEVHNDTYDIFKKMLPQKYSVFAPTFQYKYQHRIVHLGNAIFSKFPFVKTETTFYDILPNETVYDEKHTDFAKLPRNVVHALVDVGKGRINVYNAHGSWGHDGEDNDRRLRMSAILVNCVKNKQRVILSGDFNTEPHTKTIQNIEKYVTNIFKDQLQTTFNMKQKGEGNFATSVVDYIFVSKDISVIHKDVPQVNISDHLPLICTLKI